MYSAPFPAKMNWQLKLLFWTATILFYISLPFLIIYEFFRRDKSEC